MRKGAWQSVALDARQEAVGILLRSGSTSGAEHMDDMDVERDWMMACLVSGFVSSHMQITTMTAVAERLCAHGKLEQAVPLLFLVGRGADACERLQRAGQWEHAATLAKVSLPSSERSSILSRWAEHLASNGQPQRALELLLSLGRVQEVTERLLEICAYDKAALLLCALREAHESRRGALTGFAFRGAARVLLEYAAFLSRLGLHGLAVRYTTLASSTADSIGAEDEPLAEGEAAQLVMTLARLQERAEAETEQRG